MVTTFTVYIILVEIDRLKPRQAQTLTLKLFHSLLDHIAQRHHSFFAMQDTNNIQNALLALTAAIQRLSTSSSLLIMLND